MLRMPSNFTVISVLVAIGLTWASACQNPPVETQTAAPLPSPELRRMSFEQFGIDVESSQVIQAYLEEGEFMTDLLREQGVPARVLDSVEAASGEILNVRRMRAGRPITIIKGNNTGVVEYFVYEKTNATYVVFDLRDGVRVYEGRKKIRLREQEASGVILGSLYESVEAAGLDLSLVQRLEEVYAHTVDFRDLDRGDFFRVVYEEQLVDGVPVGIGAILAAQVKQQGTEYFAFRFEEDTLTGYFDEKGHRLVPDFLDVPIQLEEGEEFTLRENRFGQDLLTEIGTPVLSAAPGKVVDMGYTRLRGRFVTIRHNGVYGSEFNFMKDWADSLKIGSRVKRGQVIGFTGAHPTYDRPMVRYRFFKSGELTPPPPMPDSADVWIQPEHQVVFSRYEQMMERRLKSIPLDSSVNRSFASSN